MYSNFTEEARKVLMSAKEEMFKLKHPYVGSEHLLLSILKDNNDVSKKLKEYNLDYNKFKNELISIVGVGSIASEYFLYTPLLKRVMENAIYDSKEENSKEVTINHLFMALLEEGEGVAIRVLISMNIDIDELHKIFTNKIQPKKCKNKKLMIDTIGVDLTKKAKNNELDPVIGRDDEIKRIIEILCRRKKNNPILIGPAGVGKTAIVEELSRMIVSGKVPNILKNKRIISLDMATTVAGTKYRGEFEERINKLLSELEDNDDIILFIDEIHTLVGAGGAEGAIDASNIFKPALARNKLRLIGATTTEEYKKFILKDKALDRRFQKIEISEPDSAALKNILMNLKDTYSTFHGVNITEEIVDYIIDVSNRYITFRKEPDKSIDIMDEVGSLVALKGNKKLIEISKLNSEIDMIRTKKKEYLLKSDFDNACICKKTENEILTKINKLELSISNIENIVTKKDVDKVVSNMCNMKIEDKDSLKKLDLYLKKNIIGQDKPISDILNIYKKIKLGLTDNKCYSIMILGPTGSGKTLLSQLFSNKISNNVIKIDGSEYMEPYAISKLIGSNYDDSKNILDSIKSNPFSVLIIDGIEKIHRSIINLIYQMLDSGKITDSKGEEIFFNNCIMIMISNINSNNIGFNNKKSNELREYFDTPFINRIDSVISLKKLDKDDINNIILKNIKELKNKYSNIKLSINNKTRENIINLSNYEECGAGKIDSIIKDYIDSKIIDDINSVVM